MSAVAMNAAFYDPVSGIAPVHNQRQLGALDVLYGELLNSALLTAATACIGNALLRQHVGLDQRHILSYLPPAPLMFSAARTTVRGYPGAIRLLSALGNYFDQLSFLREMTARWLAEEQGADGACDADIAPLADAWRSLAVCAHSAIVELEGRLSPDVRTVNSEKTKTVIELLVSSAAGEAPCVDTLGNVRMPNWVNRRSNSRAKRGIHAYLHINDGLQRVAVLDASEDGIGVLGAHGIEPGSRLALLLKPGHSIDGTVVWAKDARAGIKLDSRLPHDCQLLSHLG